ncbi:MAG: hypothetical protein IPL95_19140 [Saprospiraceae bacterium]|nr:hypothetical protein [Saprospiraceae bacterium]
MTSIRSSTSPTINSKTIDPLFITGTIAAEKTVHDPDGGVSTEQLIYSTLS